MRKLNKNLKKGPSLTFLLMATMTGIFATNLYLPSFSNISHDLKASPQSVQLTLTVFLFSFGISSISITISFTLTRTKPKAFNSSKT